VSRQPADGEDDAAAAEGGYPVPADRLVRETEVRKSRFITLAAPADTREAALEVVAECRRAAPDATHHCWAYLVGNPLSAASAGMDDDGEPSGTAGKPILNVIRHKGIGDLVVVVTRYFGGVKLGAGGLVRAYSGATEAVLSELTLTTREPMAKVRLDVGFALESAFRHWLAAHGATLVDVAYRETVIMTVELPERLAPALRAFCRAEGVEGDWLLT